MGLLSFKSSKAEHCSVDAGFPISVILRSCTCGISVSLSALNGVRALTLLEHGHLTVVFESWSLVVGIGKRSFVCGIVNAIYRPPYPQILQGNVFNAQFLGFGFGRVMCVGIF